MKTIVTDHTYLVVGLGVTGVSCVRYLVSKGKHVQVVDSRKAPPGLEPFKNEFPEVTVHLGFSEDVFLAANTLVMSPGVPLKTPEVQKAIESDIAITSDIELFLNEHNGKVVAVTGSNGKSTVVSWLGDAIQRSDQSCLVAGNIGVPVLDTLTRSYDVAVLELSSFQLELLNGLNADIAVILNISEDHMDRYESMAQYIQAKQRIYFGCKAAVYNGDDVLTQPLVPDSVVKRVFGAKVPDLKNYGLIREGADYYLAFGFEQLLNTREMTLVGRHNAVNALAVLAIADMLGIDRALTLHSIREFSGLAYRCEKIAEIQGVTYVNDSKATNVGSTLAALNGLSVDGNANVHLLVGGQSKGQDLSPLTPVFATVCRSVTAFGEDKGLFEGLSPLVSTVETMEEALGVARDAANEGDYVLLSPACASFDQFENFEVRGRSFNDLVGAIDDNA